MQISDRWLSAQAGEIAYHPYDYDLASHNIDRHRRFVVLYKKYLNIPEDLSGKSIVDIGGGPLSILLWCKNYINAFVVDPLPMPPEIDKRYGVHSIKLISTPAENFTYDNIVDEIWVYNCLQHTMDPGLIIDTAIKNCRVLKIFEPLVPWTNNEHIHSFTKEFFERKLGTGKLLRAYSEEDFFDGECFYGEFAYK